MVGDRPAVPLSAGAELHGFHVEQVTALPELQASAVLATHCGSGARFLHLHCPDPENLMAIGFRTPPPDSTGVPHILEHTVLCGSERFPVKDPFVELLKTSLATFLNAMTYPDRTVYPCASMVDRDFYNLADVYVDAVFHPRLTESHFRQEGHHFDLCDRSDPDSALLIQGIVYNEMKGVYADLDSLIGQVSSASLCPDNAYGCDSGGDPESIPDLTYAQFCAYHRSLYHPSNARFFFYGNLETEQHLAFLAPRLAPFEARIVESCIGVQARWHAARRLTVPYPIGADEEGAGKTAVTLNWLTHPVTEPDRTLGLQLLDAILLDNAASPLRKALIDSGLGSELTESGFDAHQRDTSFSVGLKGTDEESVEQVVACVHETLASLVEGGLGAERVERALHQFEVASREITSHFPLTLMDRVYRSWMYDADPLLNLQLPAALARLRERVQAGRGYLEALLNESLLLNAHQTVVVFKPDSNLNREREDAFAQKMAARRKGMSAAEIKEVATSAAALERLQTEPNSPSALATLPRLGLGDIPAESADPHIEEVAVGSAVLRVPEVFANGLNYLRLALDLTGVEPSLIPYLPLLTDAMSKMGAAGHDYVSMAEREAGVTGGMGFSLDVSGHVTDPDRVRPYLVAGASALDRNVPAMLELLADRLVGLRLDDRARLADVLQQADAAWQSRLVPAGSHFATLRAASGLSPNAGLRELTGGVSQVRLVRELVSDLDGNVPGLREKLVALAEFCRQAPLTAVSFVGSQEPRKQLEEWMAQQLVGRSVETKGRASARLDTPEMDGFALPSTVAFAGRCCRVEPGTDATAVALHLLTVQLRYGFLWDEIRVKGGAYGASASLALTEGLFSLSSYRDPCVAETLAVFDRVVDHILGEMDLSVNGMEQAIIGAIKTVDRPWRPQSAASQALAWHLHGTGGEFRQTFRNGLLSLTGDDVRAAAETVLRPALSGSRTTVLAGRPLLEAANVPGLVVEDL